jgi:hypothetical protein
MERPHEQRRIVDARVGGGEEARKLVGNARVLLRADGSWREHGRNANRDRATDESDQGSA